MSFRAFLFASFVSAVLCRDLPSAPPAHLFSLPAIAPPVPSAPEAEPGEWNPFVGDVFLDDVLASNAHDDVLAGNVPDGVLSDPASTWPDPAQASPGLWRRISAIAASLRLCLARLEAAAWEPPANRTGTRAPPWDQYHARFARHRALRQILSVGPMSTPPGTLLGSGLAYTPDENGFYDSGPDDELPPIPSYLSWA